MQIVSFFDRIFFMQKRRDFDIQDILKPGNKAIQDDPAILQLSEQVTRQAPTDIPDSRLVDKLKKKLLNSLLACVILGFFLYMYVIYKRRNSYFDGIIQKIDTLNNDIYTMFQKAVDYDVKTYRSIFNKKKIKKILRCVEMKMNEYSVNIHALDMNGSTLSDPIVKMYHSNSKLYNILYHCEFLQMIGVLASLAAWIQTAKDKSQKAFQQFLGCLDTINWKDIKTWETMSDKDSPIMTCIRAGAPVRR